jgi:hypothetical protein
MPTPADTTPIPSPPTGVPLPQEVVVVRLPDPADVDAASEPTSTRLARPSEIEPASSTAHATPEIDRIQEAEMTRISPDGRPPHRQLRRIEWKWFTAGAFALAAIGTAIAIFSGVSLPTLAMVAMFGITLAAAAIPVWASGLLRGGEERTARRDAVTIVQHNRVP